MTSDALPFEEKPVIDEVTIASLMKQVQSKEVSTDRAVGIAHALGFAEGFAWAIEQTKTSRIVRVGNSHTPEVQS
jgi:hypothetical protein